MSLVNRRRRSGPSRAEQRDGEHLRLIALIDEAAVIERILRHLGLPTESPASQPARAAALDVSNAAYRFAATTCDRGDDALLRQGIGLQV